MQSSRRAVTSTVAVAGVLTFLVHRAARPDRAAAEQEAVSPPVAAEARGRSPSPIDGIERG